MNGKQSPTSEHYFQAQKFTDAQLKERVRRANTPALAARMGRDRKLPLRRDWDSVKLGVMRQAVQAKFTQHAKLAVLLLGTGDAPGASGRVTGRRCEFGLEVALGLHLAPPRQGFAVLAGQLL